MARRFNNTLGLKVLSTSTPALTDTGVTDDTINVKANIDQQRVQMKVTCPGAEMDCTEPSSPGTSELKMDENCVIIDVEDEPEPELEGATASSSQ